MSLATNDSFVKLPKYFQRIPEVATCLGFSNAVPNGSTRRPEEGREVLKSSQTFIHQLSEAEFELQRAQDGTGTTRSSSQHTRLTGVLRTSPLNFEHRFLPFAVSGELL